MMESRLALGSKTNRPTGGPHKWYALAALALSSCGQSPSSAEGANISSAGGGAQSPDPSAPPLAGNSSEGGGRQSMAGLPSTPNAGGSPSAAGASPVGGSATGGSSAGAPSEIENAAGTLAAGGTPASPTPEDTRDAGLPPSGDPMTPEMPPDPQGDPVPCAATYQNPLLWEDLPDLEVIRVDNTYYYTASTFHHSPGAPVLKSIDLVHWDYVGHSVPALDFDSSYSLEGGQAYRRGIWASSLRHRPSNDTFYWIGCMQGVGGGQVSTAPSAAGPWTLHQTQNCYYDVGMLVDEDDTLYVADGNGDISVAELSADGLTQVRSQQVFTTPDSVGGPLEGARFYNIQGNYYIFLTQYANGEYVLRSTDGPFGPYELRPFAVKLPFAGTGAGASPHQGGIVETQNGDWYYIAFNDSYPGGRLPVMAPVTWNDGWPEVTLVNGSWGAEYPFPNLPCGAHTGMAYPRKDTFSASTLSHEWEWNHNPDNSKWIAGDGLTLQTVTVTDDLYAARNTLTRRMVGPTSTATTKLELSEMNDGDVAGLAAFRDSSAWIGVRRTADSYELVTRTGLTLDTTTWNTTSTGADTATATLSDPSVWLRIEGNIRTDAGGGQARFFYSTDGTTFTELGNAFSMKVDWTYFLGYRFALFNYATQALGGSVTFEEFELNVP